ncbi:hypothetical protein DEO72_LG7g965 [Vigna unguiculata]|uniref:Uncharacterized protein n=1 Tax=Vigna unguiculata TaxID=3917 RepID=A0A4D6MGP2_VIGUN|nr:hypothetical protein DEO72_LG7g965 [Vigna unguiculata]
MAAATLVGSKLSGHNKSSATATTQRHHHLRIDRSSSESAPPEPPRCIWNVDDITTAPGTVMPKGEEKEYCCREGQGEEEEKGGSRIWCPN